MKKYQTIIFVILMGSAMPLYLGASAAHSAEVEIPSSFNPVGSGARALGMGGAFIAVADDATAASWNPAGLSQLKKPECSLVTSLFHRNEDISFGTNPEADGSHNIFDSNINYLSLSYPFKLLNREMIMSLSYQHLYDFNRDWEFILHHDVELQVSDDDWKYKQTGSLSALGISYCARVIPQLSVGVTLNFWDDDLSPNGWKERYHRTTSGKLIFGPFSEEYIEMYDKTEEYSFSGLNFNVGFLWQINYRWTIGGVFKSPFRADVEHKLERHLLKESSSVQTNYEKNVLDESIKMPMSYGLGAVCNFSDHFSISWDVYRTEWDDCVYKDAEGIESSPITGGSPSDVDPAHQIRMGGEYRIINKEKGYLIPIRAGIFYDPSPAKGSPDDFYGFSFGIGFTKNLWFSLDMSYQYRFGNSGGEHLMKGYNFSQDVDEHMIYVSMIWYQF